VVVVVVLVSLSLATGVVGIASGGVGISDTVVGTSKVGAGGTSADTVVKGIQKVTNPNVAITTEDRTLVLDDFIGSKSKCYIADDCT
jgi:hypothetical protein